MAELDRFCRFNYVLFIQRLLDSTSPDLHEGYDPERGVTGLDMYVTVLSITFSLFVGTSD